MYLCYTGYRRSNALYSCPFHGKAYHVIEWEFLLYINFASGGKVELPYINHNITMINLRA